VVDFHGYWDGEWNNFTSWRIGAYAFNRPVWISEWVWGASWNNNGIFATDRSYSQANQQLNATNVKRIVEMLENEPRVERYYYWNHEADCSKLLKDGKLSLAGEYYATVNSNMAYRKAGEYVPTTPPQYDPENLRTEYDKTQKKVLLYWHEINGEYNKEMRVQRYDKSTSNWKTVQTVPLQEEEADYEFAVDGNVGEQFRILVVDANGKERASNTSQAASDDLVPGDEITVDEGTFYLGGNMLVNGDFELGLADWENGAGEPLVQPYYEALPVGGVNGSAYLQTYGNSTDKTSAQSIRRLLPVEGEYYYAQMASCNGDESKQRISTSISGAFPATKIASASATADWSKQGSVVKILDDYKYILVQLTNLNGKAQFDNFVVARLFATKDDALADALGWEKKRIEAFKAYNTAYPQLNAELDLLASGSSDPVLLEKAVKNALAAMKTIKAVPALCAEAELAIEVKAQGYAEIQTLLDDLKKATAAEDINTCYAALAEKLPQVMPYELQTTAIQNGTFAAVQGWNTIKGTYTGGDQRMATLAGKTCWKAWWSTPAAGGEATTMAIDQTVSKPDHGYYALEAKATTEHYCVTDQHAFMVVGTDTLNTPAMSRGVLDIPTIADSLKWETLATPYVYLTETDALTVGFTGSKKNAIDNAFHTYGNPESTGDQREGWWGATDFRFRLIRAYRDSVDASGWGSVCTPYAIAIPEGVTLYKVEGISADKSVIGITQVTETEAGTPYIYYSKNAGGEVVFLESGTKASSAKTVNGLRGWFANAGTSQYPLNALVMQNGKFENVSVRYKVKSFSAFVQKIDNLPTLPADWSGEGIATEGVPTAITAASSDTKSADEPAYNLNGTRANKAVKGIKVKKGRKVVE
ncbi:MAG: hypothetical protein HUK08_03260, partial [Bacteroidaceae bacterium]|nr:hypothetical protein [Bacteroidaceae bacterium]